MAGLHLAGWLLAISSGVGSWGLQGQDDAGAAKAARTTSRSVSPSARSSSPSIDEHRASQGTSKGAPQRASPTPPATTADPSPTAEAPPDGSDIVVSNRDLRGAVVSGTPVERTYSSLDVRAYGADTIETLLSGIGPQIASNRDTDDNRPVVLLNGRRVASFAEIAKIPTEAIERMDVFPEEEALAYGFPATRKVINVVTFETFSSKIAQGSFATPTDGGYDRVGTNGTLFVIKHGLRVSSSVEFVKTGSLLEREQDVQSATGSGDAGGFRTLLPADRDLIVNGAVTAPLVGNVSGSISGRFENDLSRSLLGLGSNRTIDRTVATKTSHAGITLNGTIDRWRWSALGNYDRTRIDLSTKDGQSLSASGQATSSDALSSLEVLLTGPLLRVPAGPAIVSLRAGLEARDFATTSVDNSVFQRTERSRGRESLQGNITIPIVSERGNRFPGRISLNGNMAIDHLSDFGVMKTVGYGLYWSPVRDVNFYLSRSDEERAPTVEQIGAARIVTPNVRSYDYARNEPVTIDLISGGNDTLRAERRVTTNVGVYARPIGGSDLSLSMDFANTHVDNAILAFPIALPGIEAAYPQRFERDAGGRLLAIDSRPLNLDRSDQTRLRSGISFTRSLGKGPPPPAGTTVGTTRFYPSEAAMRAALPPGTTVIEVSDDSDDAKRLDASSSRVMLAIYHTLVLEDKATTSGGGSTLDFLNGSAAGFRGGTPRHEIEFQAGVYKSGFGARLTGTWRSQTTMRDAPSAIGEKHGTLRFPALSTANLSIFVVPTQRFNGLSAVKWLAGLRITFDITNILDRRPRVIDATGRTPLNYQPAYLDPLGRVFGLTLRKKL